MMLGLSDTQFRGQPLPLDLTPYGMPTCQLYQSCELLNTVTPANGSAAWSLPICDCPWLLGLTFFNQAAVLDPAANRLGLTVTNAARGVFGMTTTK